MTVNAWESRILADAEEDREKWLEARGTRFTGSSIAALVGEHEYLKLPKLLEEKRAGDTFDDSIGKQDHVLQGICFEAAIAEYYNRTIGSDCPIRPCGKLIGHPTSPYLAATPDYLTDTGLNVQIKFTKSGKAKWERGIPRYIWWQVQLEMEVLSYSRSIVLAYHRYAIPKYGEDAGSQLGVYPVDYDPRAMARVHSAANHLGPELWGAA